MPKFYPSITPELRDWTLRQSVFFVASAPLEGRHVNLSPKGLPDSSFAILGPNEAAYVDATGSGNETICHMRENGRITIMFCSFDASPGIVRFFCKGSVIEWNEPEFPSYLERMGGKQVVGARAIIRLEVFKAQFSCGYGVPRLSLKVDPETHETQPFLKDRDTLGHWAGKKVKKNELQEYQKEWNVRSLDGLPGLRTALKDKHQLIWLGQMGNWARRHRDEIEMLKSSLLVLLISMALLNWAGYV
ncbi:pyridoxamine phosphate oxidase family protein [Aspergillus ellipticus CBS 707.79]|uniref:Pyridoxamine phosphate oxidase family protein n=1 Tax=Aspergillus ellipticus CBS 707.79 TaxID=1448320 RepID=A0A319CW99_9EURO|nr:pyridoxamine phosphate oxidase family protein [Aspergillus ellipticus CBS 707.79]